MHHCVCAEQVFSFIRSFTAWTQDAFVARREGPVLVVQGLHRVSRSKLQVSSLTLTPVRIQKIRKQDPYQNYQNEFGDKCLKSYKKKAGKPSAPG